LRAQLSEGTRVEVAETAQTEAGRLKAHSKSGGTGWRYEYIKSVTTGAARQEMGDFAAAVLFGDAPLFVRRFIQCSDLAPRYKESLSASDPRPVGSPDPLYRWSCRSLLRLAAEKVAPDLLRGGQVAVGVAGGAELLVLAYQYACREDQVRVRIDPDVANAYNDLERDALVDAVDGDVVTCSTTRLLLQVVTRALYCADTDYVHRTGPGVAPQRYSTNRGVVQGCPLGMLFFCLAYAGPLDWIRAGIHAAETGEPVLFHHEPTVEVRTHVEAWVAEHRPHLLRGAEVIASVDSEVRAYADNAVISCDARLVKHVPELCAPCLAVAGLHFKLAWRAWSPTAVAPEVDTGIVVMAAPGEGLDLMGGPLDPRGACVGADDVRMAGRIAQAVATLERDAERVVEFLRWAAHAWHAEYAPALLAGAASVLRGGSPPDANAPGHLRPR